MERSRSVASGIAAWLTVAGLGSAMTWSVISRAGSEVVSVSPAVTASRDAGPSAERSPSSKQRERSPRGAVPGSRPSSPPPSPSALASPTKPSPSAPSSSRQPPSAPSPSAALPSAAAPSSTMERQSTWQGPGGTIVVSCRGQRSALEAAQPDSGHLVRIRDSGPDRVEVEFESQGADEGARTRVRATCVSGEPRFEADVDR